MAEFTEGFEELASVGPAVSIFGSARTKLEDPYYKLAEQTASELVKAGLEHCRSDGYDAVVVLGHPNYYPRFGFVPSVNHGIKSEYEVPDEVFMILELVPGSLNGHEGAIKFHEAFSSV